MIIPIVTAVPVAGLAVPSTDRSAVDDELPLPPLDVLLLSLLHAVAAKAITPRAAASHIVPLCR